MHVYSDAEFWAVIGLTALIAWFASRFWTIRTLRKGALQAHASASQLEPAQEENRQLRALVERQESRIRSLETIATDPAERTARAIEELRHG